MCPLFGLIHMQYKKISGLERAWHMCVLWDKTQKPKKKKKKNTVSQICRTSKLKQLQGLKYVPYDGGKYYGKQIYP